MVKQQKKTWFVYDANGPLFSWSPTGNKKENDDVTFDYLKEKHPDLYHKAVVENDRVAYRQALRKLQDATLSGELPTYPNKRMIKLAHKIKEYGGVNTVISDSENSFLVKFLHQITDGNSPFKEEDLRTSLDVGSKKIPDTWYSIFQEMGVHKGDRFYGIEDTEANAHAMAKAAKQSGLSAKVYLLDSSLSPDEIRKDGEIIRVGGEKHLEKRAQRHLDYHAKSKKKQSIMGIFIVTLAILELL